MNRKPPVRQPRSVYVRRRLLVLAVGFLVAWIVVQLWPSTKPEVKNIDTSASPSPTPSSSAEAQASLAFGTVDSTTNTSLPAGGTDACDGKKIRLTPTITSPQNTKTPVQIDIAVTTTAKTPCLFTPKAYDPLAVVSKDTTAVWDSSLCKNGLAGVPVRLTPGWSVNVRVAWTPRESGDKCKDDEDWLKPGKYEFNVGVLGGEPGKTRFVLVKPPPPPEPAPAPTADATTVPAAPAPQP